MHDKQLVEQYIRQNYPAAHAERLLLALDCFPELIDDKGDAHAESATVTVQ